MPTSRERLRTKLRRRAAFLVDTGSASRRAMSADEAERFLWSIEKNDSAAALSPHAPTLPIDPTMFNSFNVDTKTRARN